MNLYALQARADPGVRSFRRLLPQISMSQVGRQSGKEVSCVLKLKFFHAELPASHDSGLSLTFDVFY